MKFVFYTNIISPHQLPLARELVFRLGAANYRYVYLFDVGRERSSLGWGGDRPNWCVSATSPEGREWLENADFMLCGYRDIGIMERRAAKGLRMVYVSERWFKPWIGILRLLHPGYFWMACRFVRLIKTGKVSYLPMGVWAARDMARLVGFFSGDVRCLFRAPKLEYVPEPMGSIKGYSWMKMWGYFVSPAATNPIPAQEANESSARALRVLWVGRLLRLKRVDTLFKAIYAAQTRYPITLTIVGMGPELLRLKALDLKLTKKYGIVSPITYHPAVPVAEVRTFMRAHDVYVLPSNAYEGWGAVVSEALEEGMEVFGTHEAGSSATILPRENRFHTGDWQTLRDKLVCYAQTRRRHCHGIEKWNAKYAAEELVTFCSYIKNTLHMEGAYDACTVDR